MPVVTDASCDLVFHTNPQSRGRIVRWMLEETGVPYRQQLHEFGPPMKTPDYLAVNPMGKIPAIVHGGKVVTECAAICAYLADVFPAAGLAPALNDRADYYRWLFFAAGPLEGAVIDRMLKVEITDARTRGMVGYGSYELAVDVLARAVVAKPYIAGNLFSAADVYVGSHVIWGMQFESLPKRAEFEDYAARLTKRPAYLAAHAMDDALLAQSQPKG